jgi:hypothetical protein
MNLIQNYLLVGAAGFKPTTCNTAGFRSGDFASMTVPPTCPSSRGESKMPWGTGGILSIYALTSLAIGASQDSVDLHFDRKKHVSDHGRCRCDIDRSQIMLQRSENSANEPEHHNKNFDSHFPCTPITENQA